MSQSETHEGRVYQGDTIRLVDTDFNTESHEEVAKAILEYWGQAYSHEDIAEAVGWSSSTVRHVMNNYFQAVERGDAAEDQRVVGVESVEDAREMAAGLGEEPPDNRQEVPAEAPGRAEADDMDEEARVAQLADWYGVSEAQARTMYRAEQETGIDFTGREGLDEGDEGEVPAEAPTAEGAREPAESEALQAYRHGFMDGFDAALERLETLQEMLEREAPAE